MERKKNREKGRVRERDSEDYLSNSILPTCDYSTNH